MNQYEVSRSTHVRAPVERVQALVVDFHEWQRWSPWEDLDPALRRTYSGAERGAGARYAWEGNRKAGAGTMQITESTAERIGVDLSFVKPFRSEAHLVFAFVPRDGGTDVTWTMRGEQKGLMGLVGRVVPMDKWVGKDFEKGLGRLKAAAESQSAPPGMP